MNQSEMSRAVGQLEGSVEAMEKRLDQDEAQNHAAHEKILVKVDVHNHDVLTALRAMEEKLLKRITALEDTVSLSKAWFRALKLVAYGILLLLMMKFGDAKDVLKEAWGALKL